jgi:glycosyltransferase involved in cell wall biosynthesis
LLIVCIESIRKNTSYPNLKIIVFDNGSTEHPTMEYLQMLKSEGVQVLRNDAPFNFSALINFGTSNARGEFLCMLNNDIEILTSDWLGENAILCNSVRDRMCWS